MAKKKSPKLFFSQGVPTMKKKIAALAMMLCVASASPAFARGNGHGNYGGYHNNYNHKPNYSYGHRGGGHYNDGLGIAFGVVGGLLLGSALMYSAAPPAPTVVYGAPYPPYPAEVVVQQSRTCVQDRIVNGQWRIDPYNGRRIWVPFTYPVTERVQVPCY